MPKKPTQNHPQKDEENYCFECKDGGQLVICDRRNCVKVYHPHCVEKEDSFFETAKSWTCGRHSCFKCNKYSKFSCLGCPNSLCKHCVSASEFAVVRGVHGLCCDCVEIVEIVELNLDHDLEGNKISLDDRETYECLFKEYWEIVKVREGLTKEDVLAALLHNRRRKDFVPSKSRGEGEEEKKNDTGSNEDCTSVDKPNKRKRFGPMQPETGDEKDEKLCFECKDGGELVICHKKNCGKGYHPNCVGKDDSCFEIEKSWTCGRHCCFNCNKGAKFSCLGCPNSVCKKCVSAWEFKVVRGGKGLCCICLEIVEIIELKLDRDSKGNKISLGDKGTYECLFKEYWKNVKVRERLTDEDISAALPNKRKGKDFELHASRSESEEGKQNVMDSDEDYAAMHKEDKWKRHGSMEFVGWASRPLANFLAFIRRYDTEVPMLQWGIKSLICKYIKEKNLYHPKDKRKFYTDDKLFPIFDKKVTSINQINSLLEFHFAKKSDDSSGKENHDQNNGTTDKSRFNDQTSIESRFSRSMEKPLIKKADLLIKPGRYASISANDITLIYLKRSLVLELSKQCESFASKVVGAFVRTRSDSNDHKQRNSYHLVRITGVAHAEMSNEILLEVTFMPKAISISELSDEDFTEQECEDLRQKVNTGLLPKLTTGDLEEKAASIREDKIKHRIAYLQIQIDRANIRGRVKEKFALLEEKEELEQRWKHEQLSRRVPSAPELMEVREGLTDEDVPATLVNNRIRKDSVSHTSRSEDKGEKRNDTNSHEDYTGLDMPSKRKRCSSIEPEPDEEEYEDLCFECKDGGELVICDFKSCKKVYHPDCVVKDDSFFETAKSWTCGRHCCYNCNKPAKFYCLGCPNSVCKKCVSALEFTVVRGDHGLCCDCLELVEIIELKMDCDSEGNKISLDDKETYECLFKEYWEIIKVKEGLTDEDVSAALTSHRKQKDFVPRKSRNEGEEEKQDDSNCNEDCTSTHKQKKLKRHRSMEFDDTNCNEDCTSMHKPTKRKRRSPLEFVGWASRPLTNFLESIGRYETEPMTQSGVKSLIREYIKEKNLYHPKDKRKFLPDDDKLFPIFGKNVMSIDKIYSRLKIHIAKNSDGSSWKENHNQDKNCSTNNKNINDQSCIGSSLSSLIEKPLQKKVDTLIKPSCFAAINVSNIALIYLKRSMVLELSKQRESFVSMVVGTFVRVRSDSNDHNQRNSYQLVRVIGVAHDEMPNGILLEISFMPKAISVSELSDEDFTEQECEDLQQNVNTGLHPKLTVKDLQKKAAILQEDITKRSIANRLVDLESQIERANIKGRTKEKIALLEEREELEQRRKQEQLLRGVPFVIPELTKESDDFVSHTDEDVSAALPNKNSCKDFVSRTKESEDSSGKENHDQEKDFSTEKNHNNDQTCIKSRLSKLIEKPLMKKGDLLIKPECLASINANNIALIYLKRSLVELLSKQSESFSSKVVGTFVRVKLDSNDPKLRNAYHLVRVIDVVHDEISNGILLQVSFMPKAISISELSDEDFTKEECENLRQKVNTGLLPKLTVGDLQEKATSLHEDITKHWIAMRLANLEIQIERASIRGRNKQKIALLDEREELEQEWKQEQLLKRVPSVVPELMEVKYDDSEEGNGK